MTRNLFTLGPAHCLLTLRLVSDSEHCKALAGVRPQGPPLVVTKVDRERGAITLSTDLKEVG